MKVRRIVLGTILVGAVVLFVMSQRFLRGMRWETVSERLSSDGKFVASHLRSRDDGVGVAPYGDHIYLGRSSWWREPERGENVFASYCISGLTYEWIADRTLCIQCAVDPKGAIPKQPGSYQGVEIKYDVSEVATQR